MKTLKQNMNGILLCLLEIVNGVLLAINPAGFTSGIIVVLGVVLLISGVVDVVKYFIADAQRAALEQLLARGLTSVVAGAFCVCKSEWFIVTFPLLTVIYGVGILLMGLYKVQWMADLIRAKNKKWFLAAISAVISIACAAVVLTNPFASTAILWMFTGISLIVEAVFDMIALFVSGRKNDAAA